MARSSTRTPFSISKFGMTHVLFCAYANRLLTIISRWVSMGRRLERCENLLMEAETTLEAQRFAPDTARRAARNATALALSSIAAKGIQFGWQLILARWLGSEGYGVYGTIGALLAIGAAVPEFGMGLIVIRDVAKRPPDAGRYLGATLTMQPVLAVVGYIGLILAVWLINYDQAELPRMLLAFAAINLLVDALGNMCHNQLLAVERMVIPAVISTGHVVALIIFAAVALAFDGGLWGLYLATLIAGLLRTGVYWIALLRAGTRPVFPLDRVIARSLLINGAPLALSSFLALAYTHTDKLITTKIIGASGTGLLTAGFVINFGVIELLSTTVLVAIFPLMSRTYASGMQAMFEFMLEKLSFFNLMVSLPIAIHTSLLAVPLSRLIFGAEYTRTADVLQILIWYTVVTMVTNVFAQALLIQNRQIRLLMIRSSGLVLNIVLNLFFLPRLGVSGAALASLIAESVVLVALVRSFNLPSDWWVRVVSHLWRLGVAAVSLGIIVLLLRGIHPLLAAAVGVPSYIAVVLFSGAVAQDDWDLIYRLMTAMPGGAIIGQHWKRQLT